jgi:hypothetical protein
MSQSQPQQTAMNSPSSQFSKGELSFGSIYLISATLIVLAVVLGLLNFHINRYYCPHSNNDISEAYTQVLLEVRDDARMASAIKSQNHNTSFLNSNGDILSSYSFAKGSLIKTAPTLSKPKTLITNVKELEFWPNHQLPNLVSLKIVPNSTEDIPFFTSFALRGYINE